MKKLSVVFLLMLSLSVSFAQRVEIDDCRVSRKYASGTVSFMAYGNVYVETNPKEPVDMNVRIVQDSKRADFVVFKTLSTPQDCGEWRFVKDRSDAKFTIYIVKDGEFVEEDCTVCFTSDRNSAGWNWIIRR